MTEPFSIPAGLPEGFSGVVALHRGDACIGVWPRGLADRTHDVPNTFATRFGVASATKTFTAATVLALIAEGALRLDTPARAVLGGDLPRIADDVTIDHLLTHRSGIGDYLDEEVDGQPPPPGPVQELGEVESYLPILDGFPTQYRAGERFKYNNGGYVVLSIIAERVGGAPFAELVRTRVWDPAGMASSDFARSDALAPGTATGYKRDGTTNVFHLPVVGAGDGGAHATAEDLHRFWQALYGGSLEHLRDGLTEPVSPWTDDSWGYGRGLWLLPDGAVELHGFDHGVAAMSRYWPAADISVTALSNAESPVHDAANAVRDRAVELGLVTL